MFSNRNIVVKQCSKIKDKIAGWLRHTGGKRIILNVVCFIWTGYLVILSVVQFSKRPTLSKMIQDWFSGPVYVLLAFTLQVRLKNESGQFWKTIRKTWRNGKGKNVIFFFGLTIAFVVFVFCRIVWYCLSLKHVASNENMFHEEILYHSRQIIFHIGNIFFMCLVLLLIAEFLMKYNYLIASLSHTAQHACNFYTPVIYSRRHHGDRYFTWRYHECYKLMLGIQKEYSFSVFCWIVNFGSTQLFLIGYICVDKNAVFYWTEVIFFGTTCGLIIIFVSEVSHCAQVTHREALSSLKELSLKLWKTDTKTAMKSDVDEALKHFSNVCFSLNVFGIFTLNRSTIVSTVMSFISFCIILYQMRS